MVGMMGLQEYQGAKANGEDDYMCVKIKAEVRSRSREMHANLASLRTRMLAYHAFVYHERPSVVGMPSLAFHLSASVESPSFRGGHRSYCDSNLHTTSLNYQSHSIPVL